MDLVFDLSNGDRVSYLFNLMHSFGSSYICLWNYNPDINLLYCEEGHFQEEATITQVASSSSASLAQQLFERYRLSNVVVGNQSLVPGLAFKNRNPYLMFQELDLQRLASSEEQRHFYLEARIKTAVFLGCDRGEIELGMPYIPQSLELRMQNIFSQDHTRLQTTPAMEVPRLIGEQSRRPSPSPSSSLQSLDSPEYSHISQLFYTLPSTTPYFQETPPYIQQSTTKTHQTIPMPVLNHQLNIPFPTPESTDAAFTRAYLAILSSTSSLESLQSINRAQQSNTAENQVVNQRRSAFKSYHPRILGIMRSNLRRQSLFKRAISYYRGINNLRIQEHSSVHGSRPSSTQLHHMISERRRREKINDSFQALRSMLPQGTKKDKASVLRTTKEYLSSLKTQLSDLTKRNQVLESQLKMKKETTTTIQDDSSANERLSVQIIPVSESTSSERLVDLHVRFRGYYSMADLVMGLLNILKQSREACLVSMEAQTCQQRSVGEDQVPANVVIFRLKIEGNEWNESSFKEAVRRIIANLRQPQLDR